MREIKQQLSYVGMMHMQLVDIDRTMEEAKVLLGDFDYKLASMEGACSMILRVINDYREEHQEIQKQTDKEKN
jgi:hypothetical protein